MSLYPIQTTPSTLRTPGVGLHILPLWLCGHRSRTGQRKGSVLLRCVACWAEKTVVRASE